MDRYHECVAASVGEFKLIKNSIRNHKVVYSYIPLSRSIRFMSRYITDMENLLKKGFRAQIVRAPKPCHPVRMGLRLYKYFISTT